MLSKVSPAQRDWFAHWHETKWDGGSPMFLPQKYPREIAVLHPGAVPISDPALIVPFKIPDNSDDYLQNPWEQAEVLDLILLDTFDPETSCTLGVYGGYLNPGTDRGVSMGFIEPDATWVFSNVGYVLFAAPLKEALSSAVQDRWREVGFVFLSHIWPDDHSWFLVVNPDFDFTVIGCDDELAEKLLAQPELNAREMPTSW